MVPDYLGTLLIAAGGAAVFLRLVAKEKNRRERHLLYRLDEQIKKLKEEERQNPAEAVVAEAVAEPVEQPEAA
ncbi:MAG: hypothetical protein AMXMBFR13_44870 [Phycisphaerae bacterium]|jgi:hypothetical protein